MKGESKQIVLKCGCPNFSINVKPVNTNDIYLSLGKRSGQTLHFLIPYAQLFTISESAINISTLKEAKIQQLAENVFDLVCQQCHSFFRIFVTENDFYFQRVPKRPNCSIGKIYLSIPSRIPTKINPLFNVPIPSSTSPISFDPISPVPATNDDFKLESDPLDDDDYLIMFSKKGESIVGSLSPYSMLSSFDL